MSDPIQVELTVAYVASGGNARNGKYSYSYTPDFVPVVDDETVLQYTLSDETDKRFVIRSYAICDPTNQLYDIELGDGKLIMKNRYTEQNQLISLSILVHDTTLNDIIDCDPEVTNLPPPE